MILPLYAGLERIPNSLLEASGRPRRAGPAHASGASCCRWRCPAIVAGSIFTFSLTLGDYITPQLVSSTQFIGNVVYTNVGVANNLPLAAAFATVPVAVMVVYLLVARRAGGVRQPLMDMSRPARGRLLRVGTGVDARVHLLPARRDRALRVQRRRARMRWPITALTLKWFDEAFHNPGVRDALLRLGQGGARRDADRARARDAGRARGRRATGSSAARRSRSSSSSRSRCPGIVTGMALNATFREVLEPFGIELGLFTIIVGHATFCIVVVYNNVVARLRRTSRSFEEASCRPRRRHVADVPARHVARAAARRCSPAALLAFALVVRRGDRDRRSPPAPTRRCRSGSSTNLVAAEPAPDRQRRRRLS